MNGQSDAESASAQEPEVLPAPEPVVTDHGSSRTVLDIGYGYMLKTYTLADWQERFTRYARRSPTEICLPAVG